MLNTVFIYGVGHLRSVSRHVLYRLAVRRAIDLANKGDSVTMVFSGSPAVWVLAFQLARQYAEVHPDCDLRLTNAVSFLDTVFAPTPLGGIAGHLQLRVGSIHEPCDVSPAIDCVLGQVGDTGQAGASATGRRARSGRWRASMRRTTRSTSSATTRSTASRSKKGKVPQLKVKTRIRAGATADG